MSPLLEVKDLKTQFFTREGVVHAVDGVSYAVDEGKTLGLVGESGCGKSVSALSVMRLIPDPPGKIVEGQILFEDRDLVPLSERDARHARQPDLHDLPGSHDLFEPCGEDRVADD